MPGWRSTTRHRASARWPRPATRVSALSCAGCATSPIRVSWCGLAPSRLCHRPRRGRPGTRCRSPHPCRCRAGDPRSERGLRARPLPLWALLCQRGLAGALVPGPQPAAPGRPDRPSDTGRDRGQDRAPALPDPARADHPLRAPEPTASVPQLALGRRLPRRAGAAAQRGAADVDAKRGPAMASVSVLAIDRPREAASERRIRHPRHMAPRTAPLEARAPLRAG